MKTRNILCAFLTLIAVGCVKENEMPSADKAPAGGNTITVNMPELTRTAIGDATQTGVSLVWSKGDEIAVIEDKGLETQKHSVYRLVGEGGTASGTFEYVSGEASAEVITDVVFPASAVENDYAVPTAQTYVEGSFDTDAMVMSWTRASEDEGITLKHEAAVLMVTLTGSADQTISSIAVACGESTYTLTCEAPVALSAEGKVFYIAVPGSTASLDYTFTISGSEGESMTKEVAYALNAGKIGRMPAIPFETTPSVEPLKVGDYFGGGIVFKLTEEYAKVVSLDEAKLAWATGDAASQFAGVSTNNDEGDINTAILVQNGIANYPAAEWCVQHGDGWYMPSRLEITAIVNGLKLETDMESANAMFVEYYGVGFTSARYYTCTESSSDNTLVFTNSIPGKVQTAVANKKTTERRVRAVKKIALTGGETADPKPESQIVNLTPTMDVYYTANQSKGNTGPSLRIQHNTYGEYKYAAYFKFDISSLNKSNFTNAVLKLSINSDKAEFTTDDENKALLLVQNTTDEWNEDTPVKWPSLLSDMQTTSHTVASTDTAIEIDLTALIKERLELGHQTFSFRIRMDESMTKTTRVDVYSKESTVEGTQPYLQVTTLK